MGGREFHLNDIIFHYKLTAYQIAIYSYLVSCSGSRNACTLKYGTIAKACGCSEATVYRAVHKLEERGFIDIKGGVQMLKNGKVRRTCNRYYLLDRSEWKMPESA